MRKNEKKKSLYEYKIGEVINEDLMDGLLEAPIKLVKIGYIFQDKNGIQMEFALKHEDFIEEEKE